LQVDKKHVHAGLRGWIQNKTIPISLALQFSRGDGSGRAYLEANPEDLSILTSLPGYAGIRPAAGKGRLQFWAVLEQRQITEVTAAVKLQQLALEGAPLIDEDIDMRARLGQLRMQARWRRLADGWRFDAPVLRLGDDEQAQVLDGLLLAGGSRFVVDIERLQLGPLLKLMVLSDRLSPGQRYWLSRARPEAELSRLEVAGVRNGPLRVDGKLTDLSFAAVGMSPGLDGLTGRFTGDGEGWVLALDPRMHLRFDWRYGFGKTHDVVLDGQLAGWREEGGWRIASPMLQIRGSDFGADVRGGLVFQEKDHRPRIDVAVELSDAPITAAKGFWSETIIGEEAAEWLNVALEGGVLTGGQAVISGDFDDWPFAGGVGRFEAVGRIRDGKIRFQHDWPMLEQANLNVGFVNNGFQVQGTGILAGIAIKHIQASIADYHDSGLDVSAVGNGDAANFLGMLKKSPLRSQYQETLDNLAVAGPVQASFAMHLPLAEDTTNYTLGGKVTLRGARLAEKRWDLVFDAVNGEADYSSDGFVAPALTVNYQQRAGVLTLRAGSSVRDPRQSFEGDLAMSLDVMELFERVPQMAWLKPYLNGRSDWTVGVAIPGDSPGGKDSSAQLNLRSNLIGTTLAFPAPLNKAAAVALPTIVRVGLPWEQAQVDVSFGQRLALRTRTQEDRTGVRVTLGVDIVDGDPPASGMVITGQSSSIDALEWIGLAKGGNDGDMPLRRVDVRTAELRMLGTVFPDAQLRLRPVPGALKVTVEGPALSGEVSVPDAKNAPIEGHFVRAYWQKFGDEQRADAPAGGQIENVEPLDPASIPALAIDIDDMRYGQGQLGKVTLRTVPVAAGLQIKELTLQSDTHQTQINGEWFGSGAVARTHLNARIDSKNFGALMDKFSYAGMMRGGEGYAVFDASWPGGPDAFRLDALQGSFRIDVRNGQLLEVEPGAGRVLGLLSVAQLPRRLMLDFRDFFSKGFGFNHIHGGVRFIDGTAQSDGITIEGPAADIDIRGAANLHTEQFDQTVDVRPKSGNLLPVVGAVAGGPIGVAMGVVANAALSRPMGGIGFKTYRITGPWTDPQVDVISREPNPVDQTSGTSALTTAVESVAESVAEEMGGTDDQREMSERSSSSESSKNEN
ncbi:MAG: TIGR02099 family protein, partial [Xanthomonadaceae bacterium]|jgi:uncharacterized protein (TIGR02099 family)|nr:TIGR02099 family protein [Xanthomonadaceae bacterium]